MTYKCTAMALTRYKVIADLAAAVSSSTEYEDVLATIAKESAQAFEVSECVIYEYLESAGAVTATPHALWSAQPTSEDEAYVGVPIALSDEPALRRVLREKTMVETRVNDPSLPAADRRLMEEWGEMSCLWVPLVFGGRTIGCLELVEKRFVRPFTDYDREFAATVAALAAMAIQNARGRRREAVQERKLQALLAASLDLAVAADEREVLDTLARSTAAALAAEACYIYLYDRADDTITWIAGFEPEAITIQSDDRVGAVYSLDEYGADRRALRDGVVIERVASDPALADDDLRELRDWGFKTLLTVPAIVDGEPVAVLEVAEVETERRFTEDELDLAKALGRQAGVVLKRRAHRARLETEIDTSL